VRVRATPVAVALVMVALVTVAIAGCGSPAVSIPTAPSTPGTSASASASAPPSQAEQTSPAISPAISPGLPSSVPGVDVVMDPALLEVLPAAVGAATVEIEPESFGEAVQDPSFVANADAAAFAIVTEAEDLASGVVAHLRPDVFSEAFFRDWRDSYDEGACAQAGGVAAHAQVGLDDDRTMYVTTCAGGLRVYHAYVPERGVVVSVFSLGERRFGEQLMRGLRP
jgi:hypothetical protein